MTSNSFLPARGDKSRESDRHSSDGSTQTIFQNGLYDYTNANDDSYGEPDANAVNIAGTINAIQQSLKILLIFYLILQPPKANTAN
jgi:hypothetical protein